MNTRCVEQISLAAEAINAAAADTVAVRAAADQIHAQHQSRLGRDILGIGGREHATTTATIGSGNNVVSGKVGAPADKQHAPPAIADKTAPADRHVAAPALPDLSTLLREYVQEQLEQDPILLNHALQQIRSRISTFEAGVLVADEAVQMAETLLENMRHERDLNKDRLHREEEEMLYERVVLSLYYLEDKAGGSRRGGAGSGDV